MFNLPKFHTPADFFCPPYLSGFLKKGTAYSDY